MSGISRNFFKIEPGQLVSFGDSRYQVTHLLSLDSILAVNLETQETQRLRIETVTPIDPEANEHTSQPSERELWQLSKEEWEEAQDRFRAIKPLLANPIRSRDDVERLAQEHKIHAATLYRWLKLYQDAGHVSALVPSKRGRKKGTFLLTTEQEKVIESAIEDLYLTKQRHNPTDVAEEVLRRCRLAKISPPHPNTVRSRISLINPAHKLRRRGFKDIARNRYAPIQGEFPGADHPLAIVQIDHTEADLILVDEVHRQPIGRPWLTLAIDVFSRMVVGLYLTFERPSAASVGMCMANAMCPKREYLADLGVAGEWPVWGKPDVIHADNAKEFRGKVLQLACENYAIDLQWRPVQLPHFGGHVERLMGTMANEIRKLPGTTFSNPKQRRGYNSESEATLTLAELEKYLIDFTVNVYHQRLHHQLGMSPRKKWELGVLGDEHTLGTGLFPIPEDPLRIRLDFMPFFERTVQQYGIQIDNITYYESSLDPYINSTDPENPKAKRKFLIRRDPRDISKVYFFDPADNRYIAIPYRNIGFPAMSVWELNEVLTRLKNEGRKDIDENLIFDALERMRAHVEEAQKKTKAARRQATRKPKPTPKTLPSKSEPKSSPSMAPNSVEDDLFSTPVRPFDEVLLTR
ncbi:Mu transposase C-terminal domain-containing protein [Hahella ganghwensis]|uniref:Mu transposase C-terminal domain-containing protein n=1 Tax=Hahella ganghwensis TaxID=286420 RepID=UPI00037550A6|nr:Mu transposase C-terminal domain-containing protein [Hahella ganghwensis]